MKSLVTEHSERNQQTEFVRQRTVADSLKEIKC
jgi:hypothetical protein